VGVLALAQLAEAKIVYTKAHQVIDKNHNVVTIDLNHDGIVDFTVGIIDYGSGVGSGLYALGWGSRSATQPNQAWRTSRAGWASALAAGVRVGSRRSQSVKEAPMEGWACFTHCGYGGPWMNVQRKYLGLVFCIKGKTHYGWARLNASLKKHHDYPVRGLLTGYAYETIPNKAIITGKTKGPDVITLKPGSLGSLALGRK